MTYHVILLVITSNNIPLSLSIVLTYYLVLNGSLFQYTKSHPSIFENWFSYIVLIKSALAVILFIRKHTICHYTLLGLISSLLLLLFLIYNYWAVDSKIAIGWFRAFFRLNS